MKIELRPFTKDDTYLQLLNRWAQLNYVFAICMTQNLA